MKKPALAGSLCAILLAGAASAQALPAAVDASSFNRAALIEEVARVGFDKAEERRLAAAASGDVREVIKLAQFYMANELWAEALARIRDLGSVEAQTLAAECEFRMGRYSGSAARLAQFDSQNALRAIALARLGAYSEARAALQTARAPLHNFAADYLIAKAETLARTGDADGAAEAVALADARTGAAGAARHYVTGEIRARRGDRLGAAAAFRRAADAAGEEWSMRARLSLAIAAADVTAVEALSLEWRGGAFERDLQLALGRMRLAGDDFDRGFAALGRVVDAFPQSDAALDAQDIIAKTLPRLFADETGLHPKDAARLFFENVEFAPPGLEGDALIHEAAGKLEALGLYRQAALLLDHQVFKRLRGAERARVAAELAELRLREHNPAEALKAIRATRIAGLDPQLAQRRRLIEAKALSQTGKSEDALVLLSNSPAPRDLLARAEINWSRRAFAEAARDYASYVSSLASLDKKPDRAAAVRAATAFLLAGDREGYRAFSMEASQRLEGTAEADLISSLGDVDQSRFLATVMEKYRAVYADAES